MMACAPFNVMLGTLLLLAPVAAVDNIGTMTPVATERVFHFGDPQIGFGKSGWRDDEVRFAAAANASHVANASAVVVAGDLVNIWNNVTLTNGFDDVWPHMFDRQRAHLVPGNHDINGNIPTLARFQHQLKHYRATFGADYHSFRTQHATFIMVNSESLISPHLGFNGSAAATDPWIVNETETQWKWIEEQLAVARAPSSGTAHTILVTHRPPFLESPTEKNGYWNWPMVERVRLLDLLAKYSVKMVLCGHTHTTESHAAGGLSLHTVAGTARAFDDNGCGYSILDITADTIQYQYVRQTDPSVKQCTKNALAHSDSEADPAVFRTWTDMQLTADGPHSDVALAGSPELHVWV